MKNDKKIRFNIVDLIIVLAVVGCIVGVAVRYDFAGKLGIDSTTDEVEISFLVMNIRNSSYEAFNVGDAFYWKQNSMKIGELVSLDEPYPAETYILNDSNEYKMDFSDTRCDVRGKILASGKVTSDGFMLAGTQFLAPGKTLLVESKYVSVTLTITDISSVNAPES